MPNLRKNKFWRSFGECSKTFSDFDNYVFFWKVTYVSILALFLRVLAISPHFFKNMWIITPLMQPLQYDLRDPAAQDNSTTLSDNSNIEKNKKTFTSVAVYPAYKRSLAYSSNPCLSDWPPPNGSGG